MILNLVFLFSFLSLRFFIKFIRNLFLAWCILEVYSLGYLLYLFLLGGPKVKKKLVYFGVLNLFVSVALVFSILFDYTLLGVLSLFFKVGGFPVVDWIIVFVKGLKSFSVWLFFSINKVIPLYFFSEFFKINYFVFLVYFLFKLIYRLKGSLSSSNIFRLICWSSVGGTSFFILLVALKNSVLLWEWLLIIYRIVLFKVFSFQQDPTKKEFLIIFILFGIPPFSMFLLKVRVIIRLLLAERVLLFFLIVFLLISFGSVYFVYYLFTRQNFSLVRGTILLKIKSFTWVLLSLYLFFLIFNLYI